MGLRRPTAAQGLGKAHRCLERGTREMDRAGSAAKPILYSAGQRSPLVVGDS
jgi:hypothetical protein